MQQNRHNPVPTAFGDTGSFILTMLRLKKVDIRLFVVIIYDAENGKINGDLIIGFRNENDMEVFMVKYWGRVKAEKIRFVEKELINIFN